MLVILEIHVILVIAVLSLARHVFDGPLLHSTCNFSIKVMIADTLI